MASIAFDNVTKRFGDTLAVDNVSFEIADNEFFCLFGPPLSGKTTILKLILGLERPDEGTVLIDGKPVNHVSPARRNVAMVFQNLALFPHMSAEANVRFPLAERREDPAVIEMRVREVAEKLHITHILHKAPAQLSGGERQRVAIARAVANNPRVILADEPTGNLDTQTSAEIMGLFTRLNAEQGLTVVIVTHEADVARYARRLVRFVDGRVVHDGEVTP